MLVAVVWNFNRISTTPMQNRVFDGRHHTYFLTAAVPSSSFKSPTDWIVRARECVCVVKSTAVAWNARLGLRQRLVMFFVELCAETDRRHRRKSRCRWLSTCTNCCTEDDWRRATRNTRCAAWLMGHIVRIFAIVMMLPCPGFQLLASTFRLFVLPRGNKTPTTASRAISDYWRI